MRDWLVGFGRFMGLFVICFVIATLSVAGLNYRVSPTEKSMMTLYEVTVSGTTLTVSEIYQNIKPEGPIRPYDLMCASRQLRGVGYSYNNVLYPGWFHAPGSLVSIETECSLDGNSLREKYKNYHEIGS